MMTKSISHNNYVAQQKMQGTKFHGQILSPGVIVMALFMLLSVFCALWVGSYISDIGRRTAGLLEHGTTMQEEGRLRIARSANRSLTERL